MIAAILIILAAFFKAVADVLMFHFETSVFKWKDPRWWNPNISWKYVGFIKFTKYRPDAHHLANSLMIVCFITAIPFCPDFSWWKVVIGGGVLYNLVFNLFYNKALRK
jgi:hypothetical protein